MTTRDRVRLGRPIGLGPGPPGQGVWDRSRPLIWADADRAPLFEVERDHLELLSRSGALARLPSGGVGSEAGSDSRAVDVAHALGVDLLHAGSLGWGPVSDSARASLTYLDEALAEPGRRFRPGRGSDGTWLPDPDDADADAQDVHGQVVLALGEVCARGADREFCSAAAALFRRAMPGTRGLTHLRAIATAILGCEAAGRGGLDDAARSLRTLVPLLAARFEPVAWSLDWPWPEPLVTAESALSARALIIGGRRIADRRMVEIGLAVLDWLVRSAVAPRGHLSPVGDDGWWTRHGVRAAFDQLPIEALSILVASETAFRATGNRRHLADMERAYGWFLGANDLGVEVADPDRGGCRDGLGPDGARLRQGAASTLAWLTALEHIRTGRGRWAATT